MHEGNGSGRRTKGLWERSESVASRGEGTGSSLFASRTPIRAVGKGGIVGIVSYLTVT